MNAIIYIEGAAQGAGSRLSQIELRKAFRKLLEPGLLRKMPRLSACGGREATFNDFKCAVKNREYGYVALLVDSEDPVEKGATPWEHLKKPDDWDKSAGVTDNQVFLMTTCMETWIVADREALKKHYGHNLQESALPPVDKNLEGRNRDDIQDRLKRATKNCKNFYRKGKRSFEILGKLNPEKLKQLLPSFQNLICGLQNIHNPQS